MLSSSIETIQPQWAARNRMPRIIGTGLVALIVGCSAISAHGQQEPRGPAPVQGGAPAQTFSPPPPAVSPPAPVALPSIEPVPEPQAPPTAAGAPPTAVERSETFPAARAAPAPADRSADAAAADEATSAVYPRDLTPYGMFMSADIIVKAVMIGLMFASVLTWTIWLAKTLELLGVRRRLNRAQRSLRAARSLADAVPAAAAASPHVAFLIEAVGAELARSSDRRDSEGIKERVTARFERIEASVGRKMMRATGILATIGATRRLSACSAPCGAS
jgi:biopolymer transport protein ExbB